ncbi:MAG: hypothetical protein IJ619_10605 [Eubacterium sp.]|nr:hypothetical protein [Eubacterium sp.]
MKIERKYTDEEGNEIIETKDGYVFVNGICVVEPGTDADFDRHAVEVQNGDGYYNSSGKFVRYLNE